MKVYKIVRNIDGELVSVGATGMARIVYKPHEWISAPRQLAERGYHITAFRSLRRAAINLHVLSSYTLPSVYGFELWEAEAEGITRKLPPMLNMLQLAKGQFKEHLAPDLWAYGTIMCRRIKLIKKLGWKEVEKILKEV